MRKIQSKLIRTLITATITLIFLTATIPAIARPRIILGTSDGLALDQPRVAVEIYKTDPIFSFGPEFFNYFLLDTGANGLMAGGNATDEMTDKGYQTVAIYDEAGIAGTEEFGVSDLYSLNFAGSTGIPRTLSDVRLLSNPDIELGFDGIIGMPAMAGRVVIWDFAVMPTNFLMDTEFATTVPPGNNHRYTIPLEMVEFPQSGQRNPTDPLPSWAPLPFLEATVFIGNRWVTGKFLLDSGAALSLISTSTAIKLGLDKNFNGIIDPDTEALYTVPIGGVGGSIEAPVVATEGIFLPTDQGVDLAWTSPQLVVVDIEGIDGIIGMDLLTSGWLDALFGGPDGYILQIYLDFRQIENLTATMYLDIRPDLDNPVLAGLDQAVSFDSFDYAFLANHWARTDCSTNQWCGGADFNHDGKIDNLDLAVLQHFWLADSADLPLRFDLHGYSVLASYWLDDNCHLHSFCGGYDFDQNANLNFADLNTFLANWLDPPPQ